MSSLCRLAFASRPHLGLARLASRPRAFTWRVADVAALAAILVFLVWYPGPFRELAGGRGLFVLLTSVDVVLGPLLTFAVFDRTKSRRHLRLDLGGDRPRCSSPPWSTDAHRVHRPSGRHGLRGRPDAPRRRRRRGGRRAARGLAGISKPAADRPDAARRPSAADAAERNDALFQGVAGKDVGGPAEVLAALRGVESPGPRAIAACRSASRALPGACGRDPAAAASDEGRAGDQPLPSGHGATAWSAVLDSGGNVLGYLPFDAFF